MGIDEIKITRKIVERFTDEFLDNLDVDIVIAGAGPASLTAARYLAKSGMKVTIFERKLTPGGGMWGGGMTFPVIVVQDGSKHLLEEIGVKLTDAGEGYYTADSVEAASKLIAAAIDAGARLFNTISVEDVVIREDRVNGVVINSSAVEVAGLHVDPLAIRSKYVIDGTGHPAEVVHIVQRKAGRLSTPSGVIEGEKSMWAEMGENMTVENTMEVYPNLFVTGMCCNAVMGSPRMGPIFGGMLLSGKRVSELIIEKEMSRKGT
ncbi:MAG: sulfide-dependent adenosine diphosphate thiazole synthase [Methanomassiliicoccaceae archaeon]|jgi:thiazole biosynthesis enzyme|nr:thiazole biosynthesis protein [Euryarchaeota archaeon]HOB39309.1 sulfide-dependent adenosine diphosphate thiazole synthase [Methanomassiliicoccaceae archaeon]HOQ25697.1 sulfide-dependent adenosine diphosphate thiazole synthase [Methanomassiliicoccaceae archaeon]HQA21814.1 sulfide-dependent adenosine diphosphate thiazole synthase [Methanomassiliicoccaceae archaeon]HQD88563.1 sulfide-dependent adenosine diphosphate thiazole synthase [Methanomassiliicoccaceae archaeon]